MNGRVWAGMMLVLWEDSYCSACLNRIGILTPEPCTNGRGPRRQDWLDEAHLRLLGPGVCVWSDPVAVARRWKSATAGRVLSNLRPNLEEFFR
jgi:hypothetical protein